VGHVVSVGTVKGAKVHDGLVSGAHVAGVSPCPLVEVGHVDVEVLVVTGNFAKDIPNGGGMVHTESTGGCGAP